MTDEASTAPTPIVDIEGRSTKRGSGSQSESRQIEKKRSKSHETVETASKRAAAVKATREKRVIQEWGSLSRRTIPEITTPYLAISGTLEIIIWT